MAWLSPPRTTPPVWVAVDGELGVHVRSVMTKVGLHAFDKVLNNGQAIRRILPNISIVITFFAVAKKVRAEPVKK
jgi:hypothetical protein